MPADAAASRNTCVAAALALGGVLALATPCAAHLGNLSTCELVMRGAEVDFKLRFAAHLIPGTGSEMAEKLTRRDVVARERETSEWLVGTIRIDMGGVRCTGALVDSMGPDMNDDLTVVLHYVCPAPSDALRVDFRAFDEVADFQTVASIRTAAGSSSFVFTAESHVLALGERATPGAAANAAPGVGAPPSFYGFFVLGVRHIFGGYDHLLFLLALLLPGGSVGRLAGIVTAFTVAHSITLALAVLGVVTPPQPPIEAAIAASVVVAAFNGIRGLKARPDHARDDRALLTFAFGLVHGFGFAGVLRGSGLPADATAMPLLAFNVGVEVGQLAIVLAAVPLVGVAARTSRGRRLLTAAAWTIAAVGTFWLTERLAAWMYP